jgi:glycosyltransferase involved in cell wall biosynthesis
MTLARGGSKPEIAGSSDSQPLRPDIGVIALVPDIWGEFWMPRQQVLTRLARYFHVVWVDPPQEWRQLWLGTRLAVPPDLHSEPGFTVYRPGRFLPLVYKPKLLADLAMRLRLWRARAILRRRGVKRVVLYLWRPEFSAAFDIVDHDVSCYHIDDEYTFSPVEKPLDEREARVIRRATHVIVHSPGLLEKKGGLNPSTTLVPNGVDYEAFATPWPEPADLGAIPRPRIGYVGIIKEQLDLALIARVAEKHPEWNFVLVGPNNAERAPAMPKLHSLENVYFLGHKPVDQLGAYMQHMDVGIMPYVLDDYTKFIYPLKVHEYFASGLPVVASPIRSLRRFEQVAALVEGDDQWSAAIREALSGRCTLPEAIAARRQVAREHDWSRLVLQIANIFCAKLGLPEFRGF